MAGLVSIGQQVFVGVGGYTLYVGRCRADCAASLRPPRRAPLWRIGSPIVLFVVSLTRRLFHDRVLVISGAVFAGFPAGERSRRRLRNQFCRPASSSRSRQSRDSREFLIYWLFLGLLVAVIGLIVVILRTRHGLALTAIRDNEMAAKSNGIDVNRTRLIVLFPPPPRRAWRAR